MNLNVGLPQFNINCLKWYFQRALETDLLIRGVIVMYPTHVRLDWSLEIVLTVTVWWMSIISHVAEIFTNSVKKWALDWQLVVLLESAISLPLTIVIPVPYFNLRQKLKLNSKCIKIRQNYHLQGGAISPKSWVKVSQ